MNLVSFALHKLLVMNILLPMKAMYFICWLNDYSVNTGFSGNFSGGKQIQSALSSVQKAMCSSTGLNNR